MIIKIVSAGSNGFKNIYQQDENEFLIGVDGGIYNILEMGLKVDLAIGDFDSCNIEEVIMHCSNIKTFSKEKDLSDLELAVLEAIPMKAKRIEIYNATGGRLDHFIAAVNIIILYSEHNIVMFDERNYFQIIKKDSIIKKDKYTYCSIFALEENTIVSLLGFKYQLENHHLPIFNNLCLSNEILEEKARIKVNNKRVLVVQTL